MARIIVIGGTGHIGSYLCPMLADEGHNVVCVTRGASNPYVDSKEWANIRMLRLDRSKIAAEDFARRIADEKADVVIDLINFRLDDVKAMHSALHGKVSQYIYCSSCWAEGRAETLPFSPDNTEKEPLCEYGRQKYASEQYLLAAKDFPSTIIMPGQISGAGWTIINPWGNRLMRCIEIIRHGETLRLPNFGMETIHHVHAEDVAQVFALAASHREQSIGEKFYAVSGGSITLYGYAKLLYNHYGYEPRIDFLPWKEWTDYVRRECASSATKEEVEQQLTESYLHLSRSGFFTTEKERRLLGYEPRHTNVETIIEAVNAYK